MEKKSYEVPSVRVIELKNRVALLVESLLGKKSVKQGSNSEGFDFVDEIESSYGDN